MARKNFQFDKFKREKAQQAKREAKRLAKLEQRAKRAAEALSPAPDMAESGAPLEAAPAEENPPIVS